MFAKIIKHLADNTPIGIKDTVPLGTVYEVLMCSVRDQKWGDYNTPGNQWTLKSVLAKRPDMKNFEWLPLEIFEIIDEVEA